MYIILGTFVLCFILWNGFKFGMILSSAYDRYKMDMKRIDSVLSTETPPSKRIHKHLI